MEKFIERLTDGQFEYDRGMLEFSEQRVEITLRPGDMVEGSFRVYGPDERALEGHVSSTEIRMEVLTPEFSGTQDEIAYRFRAEGLSSGDVLKGDFRVISNRGEYLLPFVVNVVMEHVESTMGEIRNLFHFANLAKTDWNEAVALFYTDDFEMILTGHDAIFKSIYRGLKDQENRDLALEEFLIAIHKKQPSTYLSDRREIRIEDPLSLTEEVLLVTRNGWGYTELSVRADGDFLRIEKDTLRTGDFIGNTCRFRYRIDHNKLHAGYNLGSLTFSNIYTSLKVPFVIHRKGIPARESYLQKKQLTMRLVRLYEAFRMRKMSSGIWLKEAAELTGRMRTIFPEDMVFALYQAHYLITASRAEEGMRLLEEWKGRIMRTDTEDAVRCYYLYLTTLMSEDEQEVNAVARQIRNAYFGNPADWRIAWLLQFVSDEYASSPSKKWELFREQFERGARSPVIYVEALLTAGAHPATLMKLDAFETAMLAHAVREEILPVQLIDRIVYLARHKKQYDETLYRALRACYAIREEEETLAEICALLIKGARCDAEAHAWYEKGITQSLRLTRLYEYYMMSVPVNEQGGVSQEIPRSVLMYFLHGSDLDYRTNSVLYRYVYDRRHALSDFYESYEPRIRSFVARQIREGRIDETLAGLYKRFLEVDMVNAENAVTILNVLHMNRLRIENRHITEVIVIYDKLLHPQHYPVSQGEAYVPLFGNDYQILLSDKAHNRYAEGIPFEHDKLMIPGRLTQMVAPYIGEGDEYINLFLCEQGSGVYAINVENAANYRALSVSGLLDMSCRMEIRQQLIRFYHDNDFTRQLAEALQEEDPSELDSTRRNEILELMVLFGSAERALSWMRRFGTYGIDPKVVMRMCARLNDYEEYRDDRAVHEIVFYAFVKGRFDNTVLEFLAGHFSGTIREMRDIWKATVSFGIDNYALAERMLYQMLYSGAYVGDRMDIFRTYVQQGPNAELERAFLAQCAYDHFVRESVSSEFIYRRIGRMLVAGVKLPPVCGMDYLKYFAGHRSGEFDKALAEKIIGDLIEQDVYYPFFTEYTDILPQTTRFTERIILQYRTSPGRRVIVHYMQGEGAGEEAAYTTRRMREMYDSIYVISFVLFFGEELQYYITESADEDESEAAAQLTESGMLSRNDISRTQSLAGRFAMINDLCVAETLKDYETFDRLIQEYYHTQYLAEQLFKQQERDT
ncbi:MAG: hypothetical protein IJQ12_04565 [Lachnospiraceae bacterium]|nr:hypothetical protein [Lachnospiraceae bacterium]